MAAIETIYREVEFMLDGSTEIERYKSVAGIMRVICAASGRPRFRVSAVDAVSAPVRGR